MNGLWLVFLGGGVGASLRFVLSEILPWNTHVSTLIVNSLGSLLLGVLSLVFLRLNQQTDHILWMQFFIPGLLASFTTFSSLMLHIHDLASEKTMAIAIGWASMSFIAGLLCFYIGTVLAKSFY
jgi:CrcB protein